MRTVRTVRNDLVALGVLVLLTVASVAVAADDIEISGVVITPAGKPLSGVDVTGYQGQSVRTARTSATGEYKLLLTAGRLIDYVTFQRVEMLSRVIEGPLPGSVNSRLNIVMFPEKTNAASPSAVLMIMHSAQFMNLILRRPLYLPSMNVPADLKAAWQFLNSQIGGGGSSDKAQTKALDFWPMADPFFTPDDATRPSSSDKAQNAVARKDARKP